MGVVLREEGRAAVRAGTAGQGRPQVGPQQVGVGDDEVSAGTQDTRELREYRGQFGDMGQGERADDGVDRVVGEGQAVQVGLVEADLGQALAGPGEHGR